MPRSKECEVEIVFLLSCQRQQLSGGDALRGNTRTHPEHDG